MNYEILERIYAMPDSDLLMLARKLSANMTRDESQFLEKGVTTDDKDALELLINDFALFPNDDYYRADISLAVQNKDNIRADMLIKIRNIINCVVIKWGEGSPQYKKFGAAKISNFNDKAFLTTVREIVTFATNYLADLTPVGLTLAMINALSIAADNFYTKLIAVKNSQEARDLKTQERILKGNEIYNFVSKYCSIGKIIWYDINEVKYSEYLIYKGVSAPATLPKIQGLHWSAYTNEFAWDALEGVAFYQLYISANGVNWIKIYEGVETKTAYNLQTGKWRLRCRGINSEGAGAWNNEYKVDYEH
jgi:hypothetical protein